jgi:hypothetical protein
MDEYLRRNNHGPPYFSTSVSLLTSFRKMRDFNLAKPTRVGRAQVFEAIKESATIMADGDKRIRRKLPFEGVIAPTVAPTSYSTIKPTGFEDNFADQPVSPQEFEEEKEMYSR